MPGKRMTRLAEAESLRRIENAARTTGEFQEVCEWYDKLDGNRERRERDHEIGTGEYKLLNTAIGKKAEALSLKRKKRSVKTVTATARLSRRRWWWNTGGN